MDIITDATISTGIYRLILAMLLGMVIGIERELNRKPAGLRTNSLICIGAALFSFVSLTLTQTWGGDPGRIAAQIVTGVGFIGAGVILFDRSENRIRGITTAADIWVVAAIGTAIGLGFELLGVIATILALLVMVPGRAIDKYIAKKYGKREY